MHKHEFDMLWLRPLTDHLAPWQQWGLLILHVLLRSHPFCLMISCALAFHWEELWYPDGCVVSKRELSRGFMCFQSTVQTPAIPPYLQDCWGWRFLVGVGKDYLGLGDHLKICVWAWETSFDSGGFFPCHFNSGDFIFLKSSKQANKQKPPNQKWVEWETKIATQRKNVMAAF